VYVYGHFYYNKTLILDDGSKVLDKVKRACIHTKEEARAVGSRAEGVLGNR